MFCPQCGTKQADELKFCKSCGVNLHAVRQAVAPREKGEKLDWSKTWVAEMLMSSDEHERRKAELERQQGITPEVKRYNEIKQGVITGCVGVGVSIFLFIMMQGIILGGYVPQGVAEILSRVWVAGVIPLFVGIAFIINGLIVSKKIVESSKREAETRSNILERDIEPQALRSADTTEFTPSGFSVTEGTTKHLRSLSQPKQ
jgi:hypothetical protein